MAFGNFFSIAFNELPTAFNFTVGDTIYNCSLDYNERHDFISFGIRNTNRDLIHAGRLVYGSNMNGTSPDFNLRGFRMIPLDPVYETSLVGTPVVNRSTFGSTVSIFTSLVDN